MDDTKALSKEGNPRAISVRIKPRSMVSVAGQRRHDLRIGRQPGYVDAAREHLNDIIISPMTAHKLWQICVDRRSQRKTQRAIKTNAAVATCGIITFGAQAQAAFAALDLKMQVAAIIAVAEAIAERLNTTLTGLVIHRDESAIHAHFQMPAVDLSGMPITQSNSLADISRLQDLAADTIARFEPTIERGNKKRDRLKAGATYSEVINRSVQELHWDLPLELDRKRKRVEEMNIKIAALEAKEKALTAAETKRLAIYKKRHEDRVNELALVEAEARTRAEQVMSAEKQRILESAHAAAERIQTTARDKADALLESVGLVLEGKVEPVFRDNKVTWRPKVELDEAERGRFRLNIDLLVPIYRRFQQILKTLNERIDRLRGLVQDLEGVREDMNDQQRQKLDLAKSELDEPSPF